MESDGTILIIPVSATRYLPVAGGPPMVQAIPEEYAFAAHMMLLLNTYKGENIEFLMKAYLPVKLTQLSPSSCAFIDMMGLISSEIRLFTPEDVSAYLDTLEKSKEPLQIIEITKKMKNALTQAASARSKSVVGLISGHHVDSFSNLLQWPTISSIEPYAFVLPSSVNESNTAIILQRIRQGYAFLSGLRDLTRRFDEILDRHVAFLSAKASSSISKSVVRLDDRIRALEEEISYLESRKEQFESRESLTPSSLKRLEDIESTLNARRSAYERDLRRKEKLTADASRTIEMLANVQLELRDVIKKVWLEIEKVKGEYDRISGRYPFPDDERNDRQLLIPLYIAGMSRKGQLRIVIIPPKQLLESPDKVSLRKDFVYPFSGSKSPADRLLQILSERANSDISLRKWLRDASKDKNLLALKPARKLLMDGAELLQADGLAKPSEVQELREFLSQIPEQALRIELRTYAVSDTESTDTCKVIFSVYDDSGRPVEGATLTVGALRLHTNVSGKAEVVLPLSNYDGTVTAKGYREKSFDFTLRTHGDIVLPLMLSELTHEEKMDAELQALVGKAERLNLIKTKLEEAFEKHGDTILQIPAYRNILIEMLTNLGLEPQSWIAKAQKQRGMMQRLLRRDDRTARIRRDILQIASESKGAGGIMLLSDLLLRMDSLGWEIKSDSLEDVLSDMAKEGLIEGVSTLENGSRIVKFIPVSLTEDPQRLLALAAKHDGMLTIEESVVGLGWTEERVRNVLNLLVEKGVVKVQKSFSKSTQFWFPGLRRRKT